MSSVFALNFHAAYRCERSGVCCASHWDVPVEEPLLRELAAAMSSGRLRPPAGEVGSTFIVAPDLPAGIAAIVARQPTGCCTLYDRPAGLCTIHRDLGSRWLPPSCRHFPRLALRDQRGTFVSLTHYCPTAAATLFSPRSPMAIIESPSAFPPSDYGGLHVDPDAWPPLLHPRMLMDLDGYAAWERHMVARCADERTSPEQVIGTLWRDARALRAYVPGSQSLVEAVSRLPHEPTPPTAASGSLDASLSLYDEVLAAVPIDLRPAPDRYGVDRAFVRDVAPYWSDCHLPLRRYLAARAFANWTAYQGPGILTIVQGLESALAVVRIEAARECRNAGRTLDADLLTRAIRTADFVLNHLAVGPSLIESWSRAESA